MRLPERIEELLAGENYRLDSVGLSASTVCLFQDKVLKIQDATEEAMGEYKMLQWLQGKLKVPRIIAREIRDGKQFLLMRKLEGTMSCDDGFMLQPALQTRLLARGLKALWAVDVADCPVDRSLDWKLEAARCNVEHGLVDLDNVEPSTFGEGGFADPAALLQWLYEHRPPEEPVLSHGDYCLPNIFFSGEEVGYLDLGRTGIADKWCDIALCYRSLSKNYSGRYHGKAYSGLDDQLLFQELGLAPDWEKIRYYILLDELF